MTGPTEGISKVAAVQMTSTREVARNLAVAGEWIERAAADGAQLVVLPENFSFLGADDAERVAAAEEPGVGPAQAFLYETAARRGIWLVGGTVPILDRNEHAFSRSILVGPDGRQKAAYDKIHLFDVEIPDRDSESYRESATTLPGREVVTANTDLGRLGMTVCYDVRFPALYHRLGVMGTDILVLPAAFTVPTGEAHWHTLLRARAIESLAYVVAAGQCGEHAGGRRTYGHSLIADPWGNVLAECEAEPGVASAEIDMIELARLRRQFPVLQHRRELPA